MAVVTLFVAGNMLDPCRAEEHSFCERALSVHDELRHSPDLVSKTFRFLQAIIPVICVFAVTVF